MEPYSFLLFLPNCIIHQDNGKLHLCNFIFIFRTVIHNFLELFLKEDLLDTIGCSQRGLFFKDQLLEVPLGTLFHHI